MPLQGLSAKVHKGKMNPISGGIVLVYASLQSC